MKRTKFLDIAEVAAGQWGLITSGQAAMVGVDARTLSALAKMGELERLAHGIYRLAGTPPSPRDDLRVAWLSFDPRHTAFERLATPSIEVVSHRSAAVVHELGDLGADWLEFTTAHRRQTRRPDIRIYLAEISANEWQLVDGLPVTTPLRTIDDLATVQIDQGHLAGVVRDAIAQHGIPINRIAKVLGSHARAYGAIAGDGNQLVGRLLRQSGIPQSALDISAHADLATQKSLVNRLIDLGAFDSTMRGRIDSLAATGFFEMLSRALRGRDADLLADERLRALAALASTLESNAEARIAVQQLVEALPTNTSAKETEPRNDE